MDKRDHSQRVAQAEQIVIAGLARGEDLDELAEALRAIALQRGHRRRREPDPIGRRRTQTWGLQCR